eukprot:504085-Pyramimonas_sp.AAC.1
MLDVQTTRDPTPPGPGERVRGKGEPLPEGEGGGGKRSFPRPPTPRGLLGLIWRAIFRMSWAYTSGSPSPCSNEQVRVPL